MTDLGALAAAVAAHLDRLGVERSDWIRVGKVAEEGGEVIGALIKRTQGRATTADVEDELADVILAALGAIDQLGVDPTALVARRWAEVSGRTRGTLTRTSAAAEEAASCIAEGIQMDEYGYGVEPTQLEGMKAGGQPFYFRARHGRWDLWLGPEGAEPNYLSWWENATLVAEGDDPTEGAMPTAQVDAIVTEHLGPGWVKPVVVSAPVGICDRCGRKAWDRSELDTTDRLPQPGGAPCGGQFVAFPPSSAGDRVEAQASPSDGTWARHLAAVPPLPHDDGLDLSDTDGSDIGM